MHSPTSIFGEINKSLFVKFSKGTRHIASTQRRHTVLLKTTARRQHLAGLHSQVFFTTEGPSEVLTPQQGKRSELCLLRARETVVFVPRFVCSRTWITRNHRPTNIDNATNIPRCRGCVGGWETAGLSESDGYFLQARPERPCRRQGWVNWLSSKSPSAI